MDRKCRPKKYQTEEERKAAHREIARRWAASHPEYRKQYRQTPMGRADTLLYRYRQSDIEKDRGDCTIPNAQWIVDNIFTQPCHYCGESDWTKIGCDRINNALPHTMDNVIPCCEKCNTKRGTKTYEEYLEALRADEMTL